MKRIRKLPILTALVLAAAPLASQATTFFNDDFSSGSTIGSLTPAAPTANSTSYQESSSKTWSPNPPTIASGLLKFGITDTTGGGGEIQALFTTNPVTLVLPGDYVQLTVVFTNVWLQNANCQVGFGLYNGNQVAPLAGGLNADCLSSVSDKADGGVQDWAGYWGCRLYAGEGDSRIYLREAQTGTANNNQNLTSAGSSSQSYRNPAAGTVGSSAAASGALVNGNPYTVVVRIDLVAANTLAITNTYYDGPTTNDAVLAQFGAQASGVNYLTSTFDAVGVGYRTRAHQDASNPATGMDISSITVDGSVTVVSAPPDILTQPASVTVPAGAACAFSVAAQGFGMSYQWQRYGTNLVDDGNIYGTTSDTLIISPASAADVASGGNGYRVTITGAGNYTTNSAFASLALGTAKNLVWAGTGPDWDLNTTANWLAGVNPATFNYGDVVTFNDSGVGSLFVNLVDTFLSASSVTVDTTAGYDYIFNGPGSFAGPGSLIYQGAGFLTLDNANTYTGGTLISNASAYLILGNYNGLGSGPVTLAKAGGFMEVVPTGGPTTGINGEVVVTDDFTIMFDGTGAYAGVFLGGLSGTTGKTLTLAQLNPGTTNRYRAYAANTTMDANLQLDGTASPYAAADGTVLAPYNGSGTQTYNGVISGNGGVIQRGGGTTVLAGQNTYSGGTVPTTGTIAFGANSTPTSGTVTSGPIGTGALMIAPELPSTSGSGTVLAWGGPRTIANPLQYPSATNNQTLIIGGTNALNFTGPFTLNGNDGIGTQTNRTIQVDNIYFVTVISGVVSGTGFGLTKTGIGYLALNNTETYTGPTTVSNGTLFVSGQLSTGPVTVAPNAVLTGSGTILGPVNVLAGGVIDPGKPLTINNDLTFAGNLRVFVDKLQVPASGSVNVSGNLTNAGTGVLAVLNSGPALAPGDTFTLFNKALTNGATMTVTGAGAVWNNNLAVDGTISVAAVVATTPGPLDYSFSGSTLTLSWPPNYLTWLLQSNIVGVASSANWFPVPNSGAATNFVITVNPARSNVFYRLIAP